MEIVTLSHAVACDQADALDDAVGCIDYPGLTREDVRRGRGMKESEFVVFGHTQPEFVNVPT